MQKSKPSNFAPIFIASTVVFFLGSAFKFVFGNHETSQDKTVQQPNTQSETETLAEKNEISKEDAIAHEPEEDPVQSL